MVNDSDLITGLIKGEEQAIADFLQHYGDQILRLAVYTTGDPQLAEEIVQDVCLQVCRKIHHFKAEASLKTWVYRITVNMAKNRLRHSWFRRVSVWGGPLMDLPAPLMENPEHKVVIDENQREILTCLQQLSQKYREVLVLFYLQDFNITEISQVLKQPEGTVKSKLSRGRALLKKEIEKRGILSGTLR